MPTLRTACPRDCYDTCGLVATLDDAGQLLSVRGDPDHPVTRGLTCPRAAGDPQRLTRDRVMTPLLRAGDALVSASWGDALQTTARRLQETLDRHGPQAVLLLDFAGSNGLLTQTFSQRLWHALGATFTDQALCSKSGAAALALHYGARYGLEPEELLDADLIVFWGWNAEVSSPHLWALANCGTKLT
jgi:anaerobic selenocysteine-containing dehydrogenase